MQAREHFEEALALEPDYPPAIYFHGWALYYTGEMAAARLAFRNHLSRQPDVGDSHFALGLIAFDENDLEEAETRFRRAIELQADDRSTPADEGRSFVFVSGLTGRGIRDQDRGGSWWASIYTSDQGARYGALFGEFNYNGDATLARFYFKNVNGQLIDEFFVRSRL